MKQPEDIVKELRDLGSPLADMSRAMPYEVPKGYFEGLHSHISAAISPTEALLSVQTRNMPYEVPEGYFDALPQKMLFAALDADNVADLPRQMPYATPAGYFDQLPAKILEAAKSADAPAKPKTKTISVLLRTLDFQAWIITSSCSSIVLNSVRNLIALACPKCRSPIK